MACLPEGASNRMDAIFQKTASWRDERPGKMASAQAALHVLRSDCQQISAHPSERNASWMSARLS
jgi:hypothetical protein